MVGWWQLLRNHADILPDAIGSQNKSLRLQFPEAMLQEIKDEAVRLDRSLSWVVQWAWQLARLDIKKIPSVNDIADDEDVGR